jgi:hypothetical protein
MTVAACILGALNVFLLIWMLWILSNIRDDQMIIRTWIANQLRERRALMGAPMEDGAFYEWLRAHPDRPGRDNPPVMGKQ